MGPYITDDEFDYLAGSQIEDYDAEPVEYEPDDYDEWQAEARADAAFYGQSDY